MSEREGGTEAALAEAEAALRGALRAGAADDVIAWAARHAALVERLVVESAAGDASARQRMRKAATATARLSDEARAERDAVLEQLGELRARSGLVARLRENLGGDRGAPRFVSRRA